MRRTTAVVLFFGLLGLVDPAIVARGAPQRARATVEFSHTGSDVHVLFKLDQAVTKLPFAYRAGADQLASWTLASTGVSFDNGAIVGRGAAFDHVELVVHPTPETSSIAYPAVTELAADAVLIYPAFFILNRELFETTLKVYTRPGEVALGLPGNAQSWTVPPIFPPSAVATSRYVYLGPRSAVVDNGGTFVFASGFPDWMKTEVISTLHAVVPHYARRMGRQLSSLPLAYAVAYPAEPKDGGAFRADVTDDQMVLFRFWGPQWAQPKPEQLLQLHQVVSHESFHFWNGSTYYPADGEVNPWLHEGSAEYMSWTAQAELFGFSADALRAHFQDSLNSCVEALGGSELVGALHAHGWGSATYACGEVVQWLSDVGLRKASNGQQNIYGLWVKMFQVAERNKGAYSTADFLSLVRTMDPATRSALGLFLVQDGRDRWPRLPEMLAPLGIKVSVGEAPERRLRETMMWHLLRTNCDAGFYGFWAKEGGMLLQTGPGCGALAGDPTIISIEGHDLFSDTRQAYSAVWDRCRAAGNLTLGQKIGAAIRVRCGEPMLEPLPSFRVESDGLTRTN